METLKDLWPVVTFLVLYTGFLFGGFSWMLKAQISNTNDTLKSIKELLTNHISDTNKKIDRLNDRFDRLYELLFKEKEPK